MDNEQERLKLRFDALVDAMDEFVVEARQNIDLDILLECGLSNEQHNEYKKLEAELAIVKSKIPNTGGNTNESGE